MSQPSWAKKLKEELKQAWLQDNYYIVAMGVVTGRKVSDKPKVPVYTPPVAPENVGEAAAQKWARELLQRIESEHVERINNAVDAEWATSFALQPAFLVDMESEMKEEWLRENFYRIVEKVLEENADVDGSAGGADKRSELKRKRSGEESGSSMLFSPSKKRGGVEGSGKPAEYVTVAEIHKSTSVSENFVLEAYLLYAPEDTRTTEVLDIREGGKVKTAV